MKKRLISISYVIIIVCILSFPGCTKKQKYTAYQYPILPGTEEWSKLNGHGEMLDACQLPEEWIEADTPALLACVLTYPLLSDAFASSTFGENPADFLAVDFNGMKELLRRDDMTQAAGSFDLDALDFPEEYQKEIARNMLAYLRSYPEQPAVSAGKNQ